MTIARKLTLVAAAACCFAWPDSAALASGGGSVSAPPSQGMPMDRDEPRVRTPGKQATAAYNKGVAQIRKADRFTRDATNATDSGKKYRAETKARSAFEAALAEFTIAVERKPKMHEAWNYIGYAQRHLGDHTAALQAYDHALELKSDYAEAIEYRGEAYLGLNRIDDARNAYLELYANARPFADQLLAAMQAWVGARRDTPNGLDPQTLEAFAKWVEERSAIARQTVSLDPGGPAPAWR
jgi:tetratricopeptide (TPR) repeat protein